MALITPTPRAGSWVVGDELGTDPATPPRAGSWVVGDGNPPDIRAGSWVVGTYTRRARGPHIGLRR